MIEDELLKAGVERYSFDHTKKHAAVTWWLNGYVKFYTFMQTSPSDRMLKNIRADIKRWCRQMKVATGNQVGLTRKT